MCPLALSLSLAHSLSPFLSLIPSHPFPRLSSASTSTPSPHFPFRVYSLLDRPFLHAHAFLSGLFPSVPFPQSSSCPNGAYSTQFLPRRIISAEVFRPSHERNRPGQIPWPAPPRSPIYFCRRTLSIEMLRWDSPRLSPSDQGDDRRGTSLHERGDLPRRAFVRFEAKGRAQVFIKRPPEKVTTC